MRHRCQPGSHPDTFAERLRGHGTPGACGQFVTHDLGLTTITNPRDVTLYGPGLDMLWVAGDGNRPTIWNGAPLAPGDPNPLTLVGVPVAEVAPYQTAGGVDVALEVHSGASYRASAVPRDPAAGQDVLIVTWGRSAPGAGGSTRLFSTRTVALPQGFDVFFDAGTSDIGTEIFNSGGAVWYALAPVSFASIFVNVSFFDATAATLYGWTPAGATAPVAVPAGTITGGGIGIAALPDGTLPMVAGSGLFGIAYLVGAGIAADWAAGAYARCVELTRRLTGIESGYGAAPTYTGATAKSRVDRNGKLWIYSSGLARAGDSERLLSEPTRINNCYRNIGIPVGALAEQIGDDASTATGVADAASMAICGLQSWGPNAVGYDNDSGASRYIRNGAAVGGVATRFALSVRGDVHHGAGPEIGWWDTAGPGWTAVGTAGDGYVRVTYPDLVPPAATCVACLHIPDGCYFTWIAEQLEGSGSADECTVTSPIPNWAAAATAQRNADDLVSTLDPDNGGGSVELVVEPRDWGGAGNTVPVLFLTGAGTAVLYADRTTGTWLAAIDGTTTLDSGVAPVDNVAHHIRLRWAQGVGMSIEVRLAATGAILGRADGAYDGTLSGAGTWEVAGGPVSVSGVRCYRNGGG